MFAPHNFVGEGEYRSLMLPYLGYPLANRGANDPWFEVAYPDTGSPTEDERNRQIIHTVG